MTIGPEAPKRKASPDVPNAKRSKAIIDATARAIDRSSKKWSSGRFLWTIAAGVVFVYCSVVGMIDGHDAQKVIVLIVGFYFGQATGNGNGGNGKETG